MFSIQMKERKGKGTGKKSWGEWDPGPAIFLIIVTDDIFEKFNQVTKG